MVIHYVVGTGSNFDHFTSMDEAKDQVRALSRVGVSDRDIIWIEGTHRTVMNHWGIEGGVVLSNTMAMTVTKEQFAGWAKAASNASRADLITADLQRLVEELRDEKNYQLSDRLRTVLMRHRKYP